MQAYVAFRTPSPVHDPLETSIDTPISISNDVPSPASRYLKKYFGAGSALESYQSIWAFTQSIQKSIGQVLLQDPSLDRLVGTNDSLLKIKLTEVEQKLALISFLSQFANFADNENIPVQAAMVDMKSSLRSEQIFELCGHLKLKTKSEFSKDQIHYLSTGIVNAMKDIDCFPCLLAALTSAESMPKNTEGCSDLEAFANDMQRILVENTERAFTWSYKGEHARSAFLEYLDVQWLKMKAEWDPNQGTLQSRCSTIIQSSCAGKSRLVDRYGTAFSRRMLTSSLGEFLLVPNVSFQAVHDQTGMALGFPSGVLSPYEEIN